MPSEERGHLEPAELSALLRGAADPLGRRRAFEHLGLGCAVCWRRLEALAASAASASRLPPAGAGAPVARAVGRWVAARTSTAAVRDLRAVHRYYLGPGCGEALGFCRLIVEEARTLALAGADGFVLLEDTCRDLTDRGVGERWEERLADPSRLRSPERAARPRLLRRRFADLGILARAYLADEQRLGGAPVAARAALREAMAGLDRKLSDPEIRAVLHEIASDFARRQGEHRRAMTRLWAAEKLLAGGKIPGRRAETCLRQGLVWLADGAPDLAAEAFQAALDDLPAGLDPRMRLEASHQLAATELRRRRYGAVRDRLREAEPLYAVHASPRIEAQRWWLLGVIAFEERRDQEAEENLEKALQGLRRLGSPTDVARTLAQLARLHLRALGEETPEARTKLARVAEQFVALLRQPEVRKLSEKRFAELVEMARESGLDVSKWTGGDAVS